MTDPSAPAPPPEDSRPDDLPEQVDSLAPEPEPERPVEEPVAEPPELEESPVETAAQIPPEAAPVEPPELEESPVEPTRDTPAEQAPAEESVVETAPGEPEPAAAIRPPVPPPSPPSDTGRRWLPVAALGAVVGLLLGGNGYVGYQLLDRRSERIEQERLQEQAEAAGREAVAASREAATALFSYSHENLEDDFEKGLSFTTGDFSEEYKRTTTEVVTPVAERYDAVVVAEVSDVGVVSGSPDEVTTLVFLNQVTTSTRVTGQQVDQSRVRMRLVEREGRWLVEEVDAL